MKIIDGDIRIESATPLPENEVHLWRVDLDKLFTQESRWEGRLWQDLLSSDEAARAARFRFAVDRHRFVASRALLRILLASYLRASPGDLTFCYSAREKPSLSAAHADCGINFNVSHSAGVALLAFTRKREIGVDVEEVRRNFDLDAIARRFFSTSEQEQLFALPAGERSEAFFRCWTRKEAYIKATGDGLSLPLDQFDVSIAAEDSDALRATRPDNSEAARWCLRDITARAGYVAALCVRGRDWQLKQWTEEPTSERRGSVTT